MTKVHHIISQGYFRTDVFSAHKMQYAVLPVISCHSVSGP